MPSGGSSGLLFASRFLKVVKCPTALERGHTGNPINQSISQITVAEMITTTPEFLKQYDHIRLNVLLGLFY